MCTEDSVGSLTDVVAMPIADVFDATVVVADLELVPLGASLVDFVVHFADAAKLVSTRFVDRPFCPDAMFSAAALVATVVDID